MGEKISSEFKISRVQNLIGLASSKILRYKSSFQNSGGNERAANCALHGAKVALPIEILLSKLLC